MSKPEITAYLKTHCGWSRGVRAVFQKYGLEYTEKDIIINPEYRFEMEQTSGQPLSPVVVVNGECVLSATGTPDVSGEEVEAHLLAKGLALPNGVDAGVPLNAACSDAEHATQAAQMLRFISK